MAGTGHGVELYERLMHVVETMGRVAVAAGRRRLLGHPPKVKVAALPLPAPSHSV